MIICTSEYVQTVQKAKVKSAYFKRVIQELMTMKIISFFDSVLFVMPHVDTDIACSCLKFGAFSWLCSML